MPEFDPLPSGKLWDFGWYRWLRGFCARMHARFAPVPVPKPMCAEILMMRFRICLWEAVPYVEAGIDVPGEKVTLLLHMHSNRVVGIKVWG